ALSQNSGYKNNRSVRRPAGGGAWLTAGFSLWIYHAHPFSPFLFACRSARDNKVHKDYLLQLTQL
ncbi:MAG: hypothetical protein LBF67_04040, partial [Prevotellaceae bacterium]|nr:hypothetical protein [Prevotellaceae bacterium]